MKYEVYSKLEPILQAEYNWKFHNKQYNVHVGITNLLITWCFIVLCMFTAYAIAISPNHLNMPFNRINFLIQMAIDLTLAITVVYVIEIIYYMGYIVYKFIEEDKWKKKNGLKW